MTTWSISANLGEALVLGLATGPVCLATCGPAVLPWMLAQTVGFRNQSRQLALFLAARLTGYLLFAAAAWKLGTQVSLTWAGRTWFLGAIEILLAVALATYAAGWPRRRCKTGKPNEDLVQIGKPAALKRRGALALGFLTGINFCPPFLAAGLRAAQLDHLALALAFFLAFFAGTALWFVPLAGLGLIRRSPAVISVARLAALLLAGWYGFSGVLLLLGKGIHG